MEFLGIILGLVSIAMTWHFGTRNRRLRKKIDDYEKKVSKVKKYSSKTGYKTILLDCFIVFCGLGGLILLTLGVKSLIYSLTTNETVFRFLEQFSAGLYMGAGLWLLELFSLLKKVYNAEESVDDLKVKINKLKSSIE